MSRQVDIEDIKKLPIDIRIVLMENIWQTVVDEKPDFDWTREELKKLFCELWLIEPSPKLTAAQVKELRRRLRKLREHPDRGIPWEEVKANIEARLKEMRLIEGLHKRKNRGRTKPARKRRSPAL